MASFPSAAGHSSQRSAAIIARSGHCSHWQGAARIRSSGAGGSDHAESQIRLPIESRSVAEGQLEARGRHRRTDLRLRKAVPAGIARRRERHPLPERRGEAQAQPDPRLHLPVSLRPVRGVHPALGDRARRRQRARRRLRDARAPALRRGGSEAHPALQVVREGVREGVRHALRRHRSGEGDRRRHPQPLQAGRLPRHPAHRVDDAEALRWRA